MAKYDHIFLVDIYIYVDPDIYVYPPILQINLEPLIIQWIILLSMTLNCRVHKSNLYYLSKRIPFNCTHLVQIQSFSIFSSVVESFKENLLESFFNAIAKKFFYEHILFLSFVIEIDGDS